MVSSNHSVIIQWYEYLSIFTSLCCYYYEPIRTTSFPDYYEPIRTTYYYESMVLWTSIFISRHRFHIDTSPVMPSTAPCHPIAGPRAPRPPLPAAAARQSAVRRPAGPRRSSRGGDHRLRGWLSHGFWESENWRKLGYTGIIKWDQYEGNGDVRRYTIYTQEPAKPSSLILFGDWIFYIECQAWWG